MNVYEECSLEQGSLSRVIEEAVRSHILELTVEQVKVANTDVNEMELASIVDEALDWACKR
ncbi:ribbon-helix-helix domain-containing protein [Photorhabdus africana]|uniref:ribbon-helix-helix domain-containing protein n=1 Tax=Photorhabdus africana TaxID=3097554 RepID=UPI002B401076|nr:ribbon-helix-helix domain-containing protein [Photorhabdus sp. CRI-LC]